LYVVLTLPIPNPLFTSQPLASSLSGSLTQTLEDSYAKCYLELEDEAVFESRLWRPFGNILCCLSVVRRLTGREGGKARDTERGGGQRGIGCKIEKGERKRKARKRGRERGREGLRM
jgi:hypothetical protein